MPGIFAKAAQAWRNYVTEGVPASGPHDPVKSEILSVFDTVQEDVAAAALAGVDPSGAAALVAPIAADARSARDASAASAQSSAQSAQSSQQSADAAAQVLASSQAIQDAADAFGNVAQQIGSGSGVVVYESNKFAVANRNDFRGPSGTLTSNSGFTAGGASAVKGNDAAIFAIVNADNTNALKVSNAAPFASVAGTRTSTAPRISGGSGSDANFDAFIVSNCVARGDTLFRDEFQSMCDFSSPNGAHADFDAFTTFIGAFNMNHARMFQARAKIAMSGTALLSEWTGLFAQPIFAGTFNIDQANAIWIRDVQKDSGTQNLFEASGIKIDECPNWGQNFIPLRIFDNRTSYMAGGIQFGPTADLYGGREMRAKAVHATGSINAYDSNGGIAFYAPSGGIARIEAYLNSGGVTRNLAINGGGGVIVLGGTTPLTGKNVETPGTFQAASIFVGSDGSYSVNGVKVVGSQQPAITNATDAASAITQLNAALAALRTHGLIAP